jgi:hypothetical protein
MAAIWEGPFQFADPLTLNAIVQLQLEDSLELANNTKGKQKEGTITDAELALQTYADDLRACDVVLKDRMMAQSIALAVLRDSEIIRHAQEEERQVARDRELAAGLNPDEPLVELPIPADETDPWDEDELLEKAAALYMHRPGSAESLCPSHAVDSDSEKTVRAESSTWATARNSGSKKLKGHCVICTDDKEFYDVARVPCNHEYCRECLATLFELSMTDDSLYPPKCCNQPIPLSRISFFLPPKLARDFEYKMPELDTKDRTYCHDVDCAKFIPIGAINEDIGTCPNCSKTTCTICKEASHSGDCPEDTALNQLVDMAIVQQWQRCYSCKRIVELGVGCNHIT